MYNDFYGLSTFPFNLTPDARFFFESSVHRKAMSYLIYGLHQAEGFVVISGEVGAGKTTLVENLLSTLESRFVVAKIVTTKLAGDDLLYMVAHGFGIGQENLAKGSLLKRIDDFVVSQHRAGRRALLIVDEAQNLSLPALEELRMLSNITIGKSTALQSFLLGQPQFQAMLSNPELDQLRQRVTVAYHLVNGTAVAGLTLWIFGATFLAMLAAMTVATLIAMSIENYPNNWRLAPNTTVVLMAAALAGTGFSEEIRLALYRVLEVMTGSTVALLQTLVYAWLVRRWRDRASRGS